VFGYCCFRFFLAQLDFVQIGGRVVDFNIYIFSLSYIFFSLSISDVCLYFILIAIFIYGGLKNIQKLYVNKKLQLSKVGLFKIIVSIVVV
jgi:hypothetical protein